MKEDKMLGFEDVAVFNMAVDGDKRLTDGLDGLAGRISDMTKEEYTEEMLLLFREAGIFLTGPELKKLLLLRRQMDCILVAEEEKTH